MSLELCLCVCVCVSVCLLPALLQLNRLVTYVKVRGFSAHVLIVVICQYAVDALPHY